MSDKKSPITGMKTAWQLLLESKENRVACSQCTQSLGTKPFVDRVFNLIAEKLVAGKHKILLPGIGTLEVTETHALDIEDAYFHTRRRMMKTVTLKPNRLLIKALNGLK